MTTLLAFDTATERMSIALAAQGRVWAHDAAGGAQASAALIPAIVALLAQAGVSLRELDAIAFGRGPGAFTGLRTACSVAQGLALGAGKPVLPVDTLLAVAEDARIDTGAQHTWVAMDARMNEIYAACYAFTGVVWTTRVAPFLTTAADLDARWRDEPPEVVAGNALAAFAGQLHPARARCVPDARPNARAMLPLAQAMWDRGEAVDAALALPLYVRDKVAQTTAEREALRLAKDAAAPEPAR
ncbi:tRNA (adenosine(37)-N6)-threonylcarbamoyltransferase complex dimerization subunit type 1 TsaB [Piscinibacter sp.]|uniref:tRNA (adenosine(37)-N6)-threonylcarbamoyltransferase complex dimerization subunit type 1 TsaB n=1 Tax=Piscinibacter sp. TaxID=1903157 RepID=UPI002B6E1DD8|nr:tRNA (adenosine(37)-N6)-threonylcarbamoyltransferase complex dimerization subunit type 1 TsaB [Albitalea sp.]HUG24890.1 tRNA (adenosine(37)-N6)-threonylcarbamoyltransferase complex dimerization subunit type 1 TsaB [Albitalea sp.]